MTEAVECLTVKQDLKGVVSHGETSFLVSLRVSLLVFASRLERSLYCCISPSVSFTENQLTERSKRDTESLLEGKRTVQGREMRRNNSRRERPTAKTDSKSIQSFMMMHEMSVYRTQENREQERRWRRSREKRRRRFCSIHSIFSPTLLHFVCWKLPVCFSHNCLPCTSSNLTVFSRKSRISQ